MAHETLIIFGDQIEIDCQRTVIALGNVQELDKFVIVDSLKLERIEKTRAFQLISSRLACEFFNSDLQRLV